MPLPARPEVFGNYTLRGFEEILEPDAVSWLPVTLGWRIVFALLLARLGWAAFKWGKKWWHDRYRRSALNRLDEIFTTDSAARERLQSLAELLKATALQAYPREEIAALSGSAWVSWLNQQSQELVFDQETGDLLAVALYRSDNETCDFQLGQLKAATAQWIRQHPGSHND